MEVTGIVKRDAIYKQSNVLVVGPCELCTTPADSMDCLACFLPQAESLCPNYITTLVCPSHVASLVIICQCHHQFNSRESEQ